MKKFLLFFIPFILFGFSFESFAKDGNILQLIQTQYKKIKSFSGTFVQFSYQKNSETIPRKAEGEVAYKRPGKMRWLYSIPEEHLLVTNGKTLWLFDPLLENVTVKKLEKIADGTALSFMLGFGDLNYDFDRRDLTKNFLGDEDGLVVELVPKKRNSNLSFIQLKINPKTYDLKQMLLMDDQGNYRTIELNFMKYNLKLEDNFFEFQITKDIEVIEADF